MGSYTSTANVVVTINGRQAQRMLESLENNANRLRGQIEKAARAGDKVALNKLKRELNQTEKLIKQMKGSTESVENVLRRLDKASPKELKNTLTTLQKQLNGIQRGTAAWDQHVAKIKMVKAELQKVNATMATQKSLWNRFNGWLNNCQTAIMGFAAAIAGFVMAGRKAVNAYAEMEEQMANTQKYTRMTAKEVEELNEIFKNMDTRLAREQLNLLAQEGGRLGYNTVQSVKEYVEAASIINVALVDLGEGATQTIAKLTNIFGVEELFGVRDAMLKVGSTVNHLSQNCTAAKPFLVEFAQRMAGIGSSAKMTIPEIMAFAATLDAHGQKVEMSSTAIQRVIVELFNDTAGMAKKVGLDVREFTETLNKSTTDGLMMFLEALHKMGEDNALATLAPLFKDINLNGVRVETVLANLSSHLDFLKWQMGEAAEAFREGTSASNEYAIFNNTVQASIDKARKRVSELAIELGEKLYPIMSHIYTSSSVFLRVLNQLVSFLMEHRRAIAGILTVLASYYITLGAVKVAHIAYNVVVKAGILLQNTWKAAVIAGRIVVIAFTQGLGAATRAFKLLTASMSTNPFGLIAAAITGIVLLIKTLADRTSEFSKNLKEAANFTKAFSSELSKEKRQLDELFGKLEAAKAGTKEYKQVKDAILSQYGKYLKGLVNEKNEIINLEAAYNRLAAAARVAARERSLKTAKENVQQTYDDALSDDSKLLQEHLIKNGYSTRDAVRITTRVVLDLQTKGTIGADIVKELQSIKGSGRDVEDKRTNHPVNIVNRMIGKYTEYATTMDEINNVDRQINALAYYSTDMLQKLIAEYSGNVKEGKGGRVIVGMGGSNPEVIEMSASELKDFIEEAEARLSLQESTSSEMVAGNPDFDIDSFNPYESEKERKKREKEEERERRAQEAAEKRTEIKAKKEFKDELNNAKGDWEAGIAQNITDKTAGLKSYSDFILEKHRLDLKYFEDREAIYKKWELEEDEDYHELIKKKAEYEADWAKKNSSLKVEEAKRLQSAEEIQAQMDLYTPKSSIYQNEEAYQQKLYEIRIKYLKLMQAAYEKSSEEYMDYANQIEKAEAEERLRRQKLFAEKIAEWKKIYEFQAASERLRLETSILEEIHAVGLMSEEEYQQALRDLKKKYAVEYLPESAKAQESSLQQDSLAMQRDLEIAKSLYEQGVLDKEQYEEAKARIERSYRKKSTDAARKFSSTETNQLLDIYEAWKSFFDKTGDDGENWATKLAKLAGSVFAVMASGMQMASEYMSANADLEVAMLEKRYDREIELAEGNSYRVKKAEREKEEGIAKVKNEAARKQFAMQVIQAVAQTATNALNAYGSAAAVPVVGYILAPIAAAMAVAAGAMQVATIKKQQQASEAQGYMSGGFTPEGRPDEVAGVVHAGEWVASQKLVRSPQARPLLEALDYAQKNNSIGSLRMEDVSRSITAPMLLSSRGQQPVVVQQSAPTVVLEQNKEYAAAMLRLAQRLDEPFVTVNTVTGDHGIQKAQDRFSRLINNKSPKYK